MYYMQDINTDDTSSLSRAYLHGWRS